MERGWVGSCRTMEVAGSTQDGSKHPPFTTKDGSGKDTGKMKRGMNRKKRWKGRSHPRKQSNRSCVQPSRRKHHGNKRMATCSCECHPRNKGKAAKLAVEPKERQDAGRHHPLQIQYHGAAQPHVPSKVLITDRFVLASMFTKHVPLLSKEEDRMARSNTV